MTVLMGANLVPTVALNAVCIDRTLVWLPAATFLAGYSGDDKDVFEQPAHQVTVSAFEMGATQVTNGQYRKYLRRLGDKRYAALLPPSSRVPGGRVIALGGSADEVRRAVEAMPVAHSFPMAGAIVAAGGFTTFPDDGEQVTEILNNIIEIRRNIFENGFDGRNQPVVNVTWYEALIYALLHSCRLPTLWQWERAARVVVGETALRNYGTRSGELNREEAHFDAESTANVRAYWANPNGIFGLTGNVDEWTSTRAGPDPIGPLTDPTGPDVFPDMGPEMGIDTSDIDERVHIRGGSFYSHAPYMLRATYSQTSLVFYGLNTLGFRVVRSRGPKS